MSTTDRDSIDSQSSQRSMNWLLYTGWVVALLYLPSGLLHYYFYGVVYLRDLLLAAHIVACLVVLHRTGQLSQVLRASAILAIVPLALIPAVSAYDYRFEALRTVKWFFCWLDWIILGHFAYHIRVRNEWLAVFVGVTLAELIIEGLVGAYEWQIGHFLIPTPWGEKTVFGVLEAKDLLLEGKIRIRGLQRDVFSFANLMAMSATLGFIWAAIAREVRGKVIGYSWALLFAVMLVLSGGRSALFGVFAAAILAVAYSVDADRVRPWSKLYVLVWVALGLIISLLGVGRLTESIGELVFGHSHIGSSTSAYMRDDNWQNILAAFSEAPIILVIGGPFASLLDSNVAPMFHWADNQYLWDMYHLGIAGFFAVGFYFFSVIKRVNRNTDVRVVDALLFLLLLVMGEGIARESLTFMGCAPLFVACGYVNAGSETETSPRKRTGSRERHRARSGRKLEQSRSST